MVIGLKTLPISDIAKYPFRVPNTQVVIGLILILLDFKQTLELPVKLAQFIQKESIDAGSL